MESNSDGLEGTSVFRMNQKPPEFEECATGGEGYVPDLNGNGSVDLNASEEEVVIICSIICDENDSESEVDKCLKADNKMTAYNREIDGEKFTFYSDLDPYAIFLSNDNLNNVKEEPSVPIAGDVAAEKKNVTFGYNCDICDRPYRCRRSLKHHVLRHTGQTPYKCSICGKQFTLRSYLTSHMKTHARVKPTCKYCGKKFNSVLSLQVHLPIHAAHRRLYLDKNKTEDLEPKEKASDTLADKIHSTYRYTCDICNRPYRRRRSLKHHVLTHTGQTPYKCSYCGKQFTLRSYLTSHMKTHEREKLTCAFCEKRFRSISDLQVHLPVHAAHRMLNLDKNFEGCSDGDDSDNTAELDFPGEIFPVINIKEKEQNQRQYLENEDDKCNFQNAFEVDKHDKEQEGDFQETDACVQFLMSKVSEEFKHLIETNTKDTNIRDESMGINQKSDNDIYGEKNNHKLDHRRYNSKVNKHNSVYRHAVQSKPWKFEHGIKRSNYFGKPNLSNNRHDETRFRGKSNKDNVKTEQDKAYKPERRYRGPNRFQRTYYCTVCSKQFRLRADLTRHNLSHSKEIILCDHCNKKIVLPSLHVHMKVHFGDTGYYKNTFVCKLCYRQFRDESQLQEHMKNHGDLWAAENTATTFDQVFKCYICSKQYSSVRNLRRHLDLHSGQKNHTCPMCDKTFARKDYVLEHIKLHTQGFVRIDDDADRDGRGAFKCKVCLRRYKTADQLRTHFAAHSQEVVKLHTKGPSRVARFKCDICSRQYWSADDLQRHQVTHTSDASAGSVSVTTFFKCDICPKEFVTSYNLRRHYRKHYGNEASLYTPETLPDGALVYKCDICFRQYMTTFNLKRHLATHSDVRFTCDHCNKQLSLKCYLNDHMRTHFPSKEYICKICNKQCTRLSQLKEHMVSHTRRRKYKRKKWK